MPVNEVHLELPAWVTTELEALPAKLESIEERMAAVIRFSRLNIEHETGGPFAAGVFEAETGRLVQIGVNRVLASGCSSAHAEVMALSLAQKTIGHYDLGAADMPVHQLVVNWRPCAMCYGALIWSGVQSLVIAGSGPELERITGFDEGPIHPEWHRELSARGIELVDNVLTEQACDVFEQFRDSGAVVYNGRSGDQVE